MVGIQLKGITVHLSLCIVHRELLQTATAADFYTVMAQLGERLRKAQMLPSPEFMQVRHRVNSFPY